MTLKHILGSVGAATALTLTSANVAVAGQETSGQVSACEFNIRNLKEHCEAIKPDLIKLTSPEVSKLEQEIAALEGKVIDAYFSKGDYYQENFWQEWDNYRVFNLKAGLTLFRRDGQNNFEATFYSRGGQKNQYPFSSGTFRHVNGKLDAMIVVNNKSIWFEQNPELVLGRYKQVLLQMVEYSTTPR